MENVFANVQQNHCNGDGVQDAENGDGELDNVAQTYVGNSKAKYADAGNECFVGYFAASELFKVGGNCGGQTNTGGDAGKEDDGCQNYFAEAAKVMCGDDVEHLTAVGCVADDGSAGCTGVGQSGVDCA